MPYSVEETGNLSRTASVTIPKTEYQQDVDKALRKLAGRVKMRGFRKGKVPMGVLRKKYGDSVQQDVIESVVNRYVDKIVKETENVLHVDQPRVTRFNEDGVGLEFEVEFEVRPDVDPIGYKGIAIEKPKVEIDSDAISEEMERIRKQFSTLEPIELREKIKEGDVVTFDFRALDEDDEALADFKGEDAQITIGDGNALPGMEEAMVGAKFDATITTKVTPGPQYQVDELRDKEFEVELTIKSVKQRMLPELDDDFAADTGEAETLLELRGKIRESLEQQKEHQAGHFAENELIEALIDQHDFDLPPAFVRRQIDSKINQQFKQLQEQGLDIQNMDIDLEDIRENLREETEDQLRAEFLLLAIAEKEGLEVNDQDLQNYISHQAMHSNIPPQQLVRWYQEDPKRVQQAAGSALLEKTVNYLLSEAEIEEIEWPSDEEQQKRDEAKEKKKAARAKKSAKSAKPAKKADKAEKADKPEKKEAAAKTEEDKPAPKGGVPKTKPKTDQPAAAPDSNDAREAFSAKTVDELKDYLRDHDLKVSGKKAELIDRLVEAGVNP